MQYVERLALLDVKLADVLLCDILFAFVLSLRNHISHPKLVLLHSNHVIFSKARLVLSF